MVRGKAIPQLWKLRCRFEYSDGKPTWRSMWDQSGPNPVDSAWAQSKENLLVAIIEGKRIDNAEIKVLAECPGQDFCNFEWQAFVPGALALGAANPTQTHYPIIIGLVLVTRDTRLTIFRDGTMHVEPRTEEDKALQLTSYGK